jgi:hypothetical protein
MQALRADVKALREELRTIREQGDEELGDESDDRAIAAARDGDAAGSATVIWNGYKPASKRASRRGGKKSVAL